MAAAPLARCLRALIAISLLLAGCAPTLRPWGSPDAAAEGGDIGQRLPDLTFHSADGRPRQLSDFRGKVVFVNFLASWCPPCRAEMPSMQRLYDRLRARPEIEFILLNAMEDYDTTLQWARRERYTLPLYDSTQTTLYSRPNWISGASFPIRSGGTFGVYFIPRTYILDRNGIVVWTGREQDWDRGWLDSIVGLAAASETGRPSR